MPFMRALAMVRQHLDHAAFAHTLVAAFFYHAPQLGPQGHQLLDPSFHLDHVSAGDSAGFSTGLVRLFTEFQQLANGLDVEAEVARMADKVKTGNVIGSVAPLFPLGPGRQARLGRSAGREEGRR